MNKVDGKNLLLIPILLTSAIAQTSQSGFDNEFLTNNRSSMI